MSKKTSSSLYVQSTVASLETLGVKIITCTCSGKEEEYYDNTRIREFEFDRFLVWRTDGRYELVRHMYS